LKKRTALFFLMVILAATSRPSFGFNAQIGDDFKVKLKGELMYAAKFRMEHPDPELVGQSMGNSNFEKYDMVNDRASLTLEMDSAYKRLSVYLRGEAFYDAVYNDDDVFSQESMDYAAYDLLATDAYLQGDFNALTFRIGKQIVEWGESILPAYMVVNSISPPDLDKISRAGYTSRDYKVPSFMVWTSYEVTPTLALEGVWAPQYEPRDSFPVVGTWGSFADYIGYGALPDFNGIAIVDERPETIYETKQFGFAAQKLFTGLDNFELGLYYFHHLARAPKFTINLLEQALTMEYPEMDMFGASFSQAIEKFNLFLQLGGELAYRPNNAIQKNWLLSEEEADLLNLLAIINGDEPTSAEGDNLGPFGGYDEGGVVAWEVSGMRLFSDVLPFTPWTFSLAALFELSGEIIQDYKEGLYANPKSQSFYLLQLPFSTPDMIDNTNMEFLLQFQGNLHKEKRSNQQISFQIKAKYGNSLQGEAGYQLKLGKPEENGMTDRDDLYFKISYFFQ